MKTWSSDAPEGKPKAEEVILGRCRIDDLPTFVARAKSRADSRGDLSRARADRERANRSTAGPAGVRLD